jgi:hypothetical protein
MQAFQFVAVDGGSYKITSINSQGSLMRF